MNKEKIEILIVMVVLLVLSYAVCGCKDKAIERVEPNEPNDIWVYDPNMTITSDYAMAAEIDFAVDTLEMAGATMYLKNMPLLTKDEIRDFAIVIGAATTKLYACDEYYKELLRLVPSKLLQKPKEDE